MTPSDRAAAPVIVAALDGSAPSRSTTALAAELIKTMGWRLALVPVPLTATDADRRSRLVAAALDEHATLIASPATDQRSSGRAAAAACLALAACAPCPVLALPLARGTEPALSGRVICGVDGAKNSARIAGAAARLAAALNASVELVHVAAPREDGAPESGGPAGRLRCLAESEGALWVIGAPAEGEDEGEGDGRLAATILTESRVPVAVVSGGDRSVPVVAGVALNAVAA
jgi:nucleotide-binding universal stress UspA family protein